MKTKRQNPKQFRIRPDLQKEYDAIKRNRKMGDTEMMNHCIECAIDRKELFPLLRDIVNALKELKK